MLTLRKVGATPGDPGWEVVDAPREVGRTPPVDIALLDRSVSRHHARLRRAGGEFLVEDLNSKNGTYVNDRQVVRSSPIGDGDRIAFGDVVLVAEVRLNRRSPGATEMPGVSPPVGGTVLYSDKAPSPAATVLDPEGPTPSLSLRREPTPPGPLARPSISKPSVAADGLVALRRLEQDLSAAVTEFEHQGGTETLSAILDRLSRIEGRRTGQELEALSNWLPTVRAMLEVELRLINALGVSSSAASGHGSRDELQSHTGHIERVSRS